MKHSFVAAIALGMAAAATDAWAQEETPPQTWTQDEAGDVTHIASGAKCPGALHGIGIVDVLSYDREVSQDHVGVSCVYGGPDGSQGVISILRADVEDLAGAGSPANTFNEAMRGLLLDYPNAFPRSIDGLGDDDAANLFGSMMEVANARGVPVLVGLWFADGESWVVRGEATFPGTDVGVDSAKALREAVIVGTRTAG